MCETYCPAPGLQLVLGSVLASYDLEPTPAAWSRTPQPARTFAAQMQRLQVGAVVLAKVRQAVPISDRDRRLIERLVDSACQRLEEQGRPSIADLLEPAIDRQDVAPPPLTTNPIRPAAPSRPPGASPPQTNQTRTIRSSRWKSSPARKEAAQ